jgi:hypothetical protein
MHCPTCSKRLPYSVRFCAYCGTALARRPWQAWLAAVSLPTVSRPAAMLGALGAALGALLGGFTGQLLGDPSQGDAFLGGLVGALGLGVASAWGDTLAATYLERESARRFGQLYGGVGGALAALGGFLVAVVILWQAGQPGGVAFALDLLTDNLLPVVRIAVIGGFLGAALGILAGRFGARVGYNLLQRRGAVIGAALAWTLGGIVGGLFAGDSAARLVGGDPIAGALLGMVVQVGLGALILTQVQRLVRAYRTWRRPVSKPHP